MLGRASQQARTLLRLLRSQTKQKSCSTTAPREGGRLLEGRGQVGTSSQDSKITAAQLTDLGVRAGDAGVVDERACSVDGGRSGPRRQRGEPASWERTPSMAGGPHRGHRHACLHTAAATPRPWPLGKIRLVAPFRARCSLRGRARRGLGTSIERSRRAGAGCFGRTLVERQSGLRQARRADPELANLRARGR